jgi:hypothetical protein
MTQSSGMDGVIFDVLERAAKLTGLPHPSDPSSTETAVAEWRRRREAPPVVSVKVGCDMSADEVIDLLRAAM